MLNKKQRIKLIMMTNHDKYGQLLADAYDSWTRKEIKPITRRSGVQLYKEDSSFFSSEEKTCCLQGAALIDKPINQGFYEDIETFYQLSETEANNIRYGFDQSKHGDSNSEEFKFANAISNLIFGHIKRNVRNTKISSI